MNISFGKFSTVLIGSMLIIAGVVMKNTNEQLKADKKMPQLDTYGMVSFLLGWGVVAYGVAMNDNGILPMNKRTLFVGLAAAGVVVAVMLLKRFKDVKILGMDVPKMLPPALFAGSWLVLGALSKNSVLGIGSALMVLLSMMVSLPWQRANCIVDGPGMPLFVVAWYGMAFANSM